jgi:propanediol utilization protein
VNERTILEAHIDTDEGNACHLPSSTRLALLKQK